MPTEGDTSIKDVSGALGRHGIRLERVTAAYHQKGGPLFNVFQRQDCRLVVVVRLENHAGQSWTHFVAWDGQKITDRPYFLKIACHQKLLLYQIRCFAGRT